ncbi:unnamed protein product [Brugia pahangi]|uniref:Uncharacterized protein n=1 Tax=Brugia pahangi TaxID=6280 RepID=A0A0N4TMI2_BRUPA|nr:unnamed protein product [Brugia pahangi]
MSTARGCEGRIHFILVSCSSFHSIILAQPPPNGGHGHGHLFTAVMCILLSGNESFRQLI